MDLLNERCEKKGVIKKTLERCKSFAAFKAKSSKCRDDDERHGHHAMKMKKKSKSWSSLVLNRDGTKKFKVVPEGCFSVYVGPHKQRFLIKTEYVNHPLFKMLLEEAESEYGYCCEGPLLLPCHVDYFLKVLTEMDSDDHHGIGCGFSRSPNSYHLLTPKKLIAVNQV